MNIVARKMVVASSLTHNATCVFAFEPEIWCEAIWVDGELKTLISFPCFVVGYSNDSTCFYPTRFSLIHFINTLRVAHVCLINVLLSKQTPVHTHRHTLTIGIVWMYKILFQTNFLPTVWAVVYLLLEFSFVSDRRKAGRSTGAMLQYWSNGR